MSLGSSKLGNVATVSSETRVSKSEESSQDGFSTVPLSEFLQMQLPVRQLLLDPWLPDKGLAMIYASRGIGKTFLGLSVGLAVAGAGGLLGWKAENPAAVLYVDGEMAAIDVQTRLKSLIKGNPQFERASEFRLSSLDLNCRLGSPDLSTILGQKKLDSAMPRDTQLIVLDNLSSLISGDENDSAVWHPVQQWLLQHRANGRSVLLIHHAGKKGAQRGTSSREDVLDTVIGLKRPKSYSASQGARFEVHFEKSRGIHGADVRSFEAALKTDTDGGLIWTRRRLTSTRERVAELYNEGLSQTEIAKRIGVNKSTVSRHVKGLKTSDAAGGNT